MSEPLKIQQLADLSDTNLAEAYAPRGEPWLRVNFVSTVDGAATGSDGLSKSINDDADGRVFNVLRSRPSIPVPTQIFGTEPTTSSS